MSSLRCTSLPLSRRWFPTFAKDFSTSLHPWRLDGLATHGATASAHLVLRPIFEAAITNPTLWFRCFASHVSEAAASSVQRFVLEAASAYPKGLRRHAWPRNAASEVASASTDYVLIAIHEATRGTTPFTIRTQHKGFSSSSLSRRLASEKAHATTQRVMFTVFEATQYAFPISVWSLHGDVDSVSGLFASDGPCTSADNVLSTVLKHAKSAKPRSVAGFYKLWRPIRILLRQRGYGRGCFSNRKTNALRIRLHGAGVTTCAPRRGPA